MGISVCKDSGPLSSEYNYLTPIFAKCNAYPSTSLNIISQFLEVNGLMVTSGPESIWLTSGSHLYPTARLPSLPHLHNNPTNPWVPLVEVTPLSDSFYCEFRVTSLLHPLDSTLAHLCSSRHIEVLRKGHHTEPHILATFREYENLKCLCFFSAFSPILLPRVSVSRRG